MFKEYYTGNQPENWDKAPPKRNLAGRYKSRCSDAGFECRHCQADVPTLPSLSGVQNRNHCPFCLWSRHIDYLKAGDRMSACKALMQPIGLSMKYSHDKYACCKSGELMLIHRCSECGKLSINRIAADDQADRINGVYYASFRLDMQSRSALDQHGIHLLGGRDKQIVLSQLYGIRQN